MSFKAVLKTKQNRLLSKTWRITLVTKTARYEIPQSILDEFANEPIVIFSSDSLATQPMGVGVVQHEFNNPSSRA